MTLPLSLPRPVAAAPIHRRLALALEPVEAARRLRHRRRFVFLDSSAAGGREGRFSVLAADPSLVMEARGSEIVWSEEGRRSVHAEDPFTALEALVSRFPPDPARGEETAFRGGAIGYLGFDLFRALERYPAGRAVDDLGLPDLVLGLYDAALVYDHRDRCWLQGATPGVGRSAQEIESLAEEWLGDLAREPAAATPAARGAPGSTGLESNFTRDSYLRAVEEAVELIRAGEIYQVNLSQRFRARIGDRAFELFEALRQVSPCRYGSFLACGDHTVVGSSPELFLRRRGAAVETRPIKGTRPRGADPSEDARLRAELQESAKDRAELAMIVDLCRNDLGRVCDTGSVEVAAHARVTTLPAVHHTVSTVRGRLRPEVGPVELLRATFPAGSISGCPKIRALEVIDALEPVRRHVYTGAVGYLGFDGDLALNVAIRTAVARGDELYFQVGGGIVADSDPAAEYQETLDKAQGMLRALELLEGADV